MRAGTKLLGEDSRVMPPPPSTSTYYHRARVAGIRAFPWAVQSVVEYAPQIEALARDHSHRPSMFFIGRNINFPMALEGALKMKEISYVHAEGYAAGGLKHGPLALITAETPVVALVPEDHTYEKMIGKIREVSARGAPVVAIGYEGDEELKKYVDTVLRVPWVRSIYSPVVHVVALQLLAYYTASERECSIDKPRDLAKSVTVE